MVKHTLSVIALGWLLVASPSAQTRPTERPTPKPESAGQQPRPAPPREATPRPEPQGQPVNVRLELTITDQTGPGEPSRKVITMIVADRQNGFIRSKATVRSADTRFRDVTINVDARPVLLKEGMVRVDLGLEYQPQVGADRNANTQSNPTTLITGPDPFGSNLNERIGVILETGKPLVVSQAADPSSDRRISVELKATVVK